MYSIPQVIGADHNSIAGATVISIESAAAARGPLAKGPKLTAHTSFLKLSMDKSTTLDLIAAMRGVPISCKSGHSARVVASRTVSIPTTVQKRATTTKPKWNPLFRDQWYDSKYLIDGVAKLAIFRER